jgi:hypothetical protein
MAGTVLPSKRSSLGYHVKLDPSPRRHQTQPSEADHADILGSWRAGQMLI